MLKNNKGFTLVELLAIVVILAIIMVLAAPSMTKQIAKKEKTDETILDEKIHNASKIYAAKYYSEKIVDLPTCTENCEIKFTLNDLEQDGLINLKDKCTGKTNENIIISYGSSIEYNYNAIKDDDCASSNIGS
ncbi:MAG: Tfp pilus assembly protein FimT/FimU [Candidatus Aphodocola sp.]